MDIYQEFCADPTFSASYELIKKYVARRRTKSPEVYERLEHPPGAEAQADFGELVRVKHQGRLVRTWAYVSLWPHSRWRYAEVVLDQTVPTFLNCVQNGVRASGATPQRSPSIIWLPAYCASTSKSALTNASLRRCALITA